MVTMDAFDDTKWKYVYPMGRIDYTSKWRCGCTTNDEYVGMTLYLHMHYLLYSTCSEIFCNTCNRFVSPEMWMSVLSHTCTSTISNGKRLSY